jgi:hypothetical protein
MTAMRAGSPPEIPGVVGHPPQRRERVVGRRRELVFRSEAVARCDDDRADVVGERARRLVDHGKPAGDESAAVEVHDDR